jgi:hypothetical protein
MSYRTSARALFALLAVGVLWVVRDYGVTWDEPDHNDYGRMVARFYASGGRDLPDDPYLHLYGAAFDAPASVLGSVSPLGLWPTRHLLNAAVGWLGILGAWACARAMAGEGAAFWAAALLALTPCWWGHMFNNPKDIPFAAGYVWSLALLLRFLAAWPRVTLRFAAALGVIMGLTMGVRVGGVLLLGYLALAVLWPASGPDDPGIRRAGGPAAGAALLAWGVMLLCWPYALLRPVSWPVEALTKFMHYAPLKFAVIFRGESFPATDLPWSYLPRHLLVMCPEPLLLLLAGGLAAGVVRLALGERPSREAAGRWGFVIMAALLPVGLVIAGRSVVYNGLRHLLFVVPPLAVLGGAALAAFATWLTRRPAAVRVAAWGLLAAWLGWHLSVSVRIHPHEYIQYNAFAGGLPGALYNYELDYWGNSYPEAIRDLEARLATEAPLGRRWRIASCGADRAFRADLPGTFEAVDSLGEADFVAMLTGLSCPGTQPDGPAVVVVDRFGVPLSFVLDLRRPGPGVR